MVAPAIVAAGISALGSLFGGSRSDKAAKNQVNAQIASNEAINKWNADMQMAINRENNEFTREMDALNYSRQLDAAQNSTQWKVADAKAAGLHPLYAMGASGLNITPSSLIGNSVAPVAQQTHTSMRSSSMGAALNDMGQNLSRAIASMETREQRQERADLKSYTHAMRSLELENQSLENDYLRSNIARLQREQIGPPAPSVDLHMGGGVGSSRVQPVPAMPVINSTFDPSREAGNITDRGYTRGADGRLYPVPSQDVKNRIEDNDVQEALWNWRNVVVPFFSKNNSVPSLKEFPLPKGQAWGFDRWSMSYRPFYTATRKWVK